MKRFVLILFFLTALNFEKAYTQNMQQTQLEITKNLRCLICQGQSVYDSQSEFSESIKILIEKKIEEGYSKNEIYDFLIDKYGQWIVYDPGFSKKTAILWILPILLFFIGGAIILNKFILRKL